MSKPSEVSAGALCDAVVEELAGVMAALLGVEAAAAPSLTAGEPRWQVAMTVAGTSTGHVDVAISGAEAARLAQLVMGFDETPDDGAVRDMLQEICGQAAGALSQRGFGLTFVAGHAAPFAPAPGHAEVGWFQVRLTESFSPLVGCWCRLEPVAAAVGAGMDPRPADGPPAAPPRVTPAYPPNLEVILDIELPMTVRFGQTELTLDALTRLGPGSVIDLGRAPDDPVDVLVNGRLVARGEVVVASGNYGVRVTEVVSTSDRLRSMGGLRTRATDRT
jgi:flagellar motor switch protein FliN